ncbi:uncharacterized protein PHALS_05010 [Plasmopara halstedii]|uniref:Uncharacterized protein n=1 Tax=Plasmopara halstedii TaxID=4781 RepID=A0A0P1A9K8_PLAHL|nr:uncharacterized protein PHALS_05010 [Plasmopara halstedii]CEG37416.1 hypothetical protein PHALS_05010 [Plasmopara halstedii]|eukprot:XP_024573785.1 hypothetical protein PHALS_05010 [Plasmopara halstedii]
MALRARNTKRARPQASPSIKRTSGDDRFSGYSRPSGFEDSQHDDQPRRKRAMVSADLQFLKKMPPLRDYQRGRFGRRGGVDGGAPDGSSSLWMRALEESMEETSFVTREAPIRAAVVAPMSMPLNISWNNSSENRPTTISGPGRTGVTAPLPRSNIADEDTVRRRRLYALQALRGSGKDDEARPATEGLVL